MGFVDSQTPIYHKANDIDDTWSRNDPTVPAGWMIRMIGGLKNSYHLLSPDMKHFTGRRKALEFLIEKNYPEEEIDEMRSCLRFDGWFEDSALPSKWLFKKQTDHGTSFIDSRAKLFRSKDAVWRFYENAENFIEIKESITEFLESQTPVYNKGKELDSSWIENDERVPPEPPCR